MRRCFHAINIINCPRIEFRYKHRRSLVISSGFWTSILIWILFNSATSKSWYIGINNLWHCLIEGGKQEIYVTSVPISGRSRKLRSLPNLQCLPTFSETYHRQHIRKNSVISLRASCYQSIYKQKFWYWKGCPTVDTASFCAFVLAPSFSVLRNANVIWSDFTIFRLSQFRVSCQRNRINWVRQERSLDIREPQIHYWDLISVNWTMDLMWKWICE